MTAKWFFVFSLIYSVLQGAVMNPAIISKTQAALVERYGKENRARITAGVLQAAALWRESDGDEQQFHQFCVENFIADPDTLRMTYERLQRNLEILQGHSHEISRGLKMPVELVMDPLLSVDYMFAEYDPFAHIQDDLFSGKIAFVCLLNFPIYSLENKLSLGAEWSREQWAQARLADAFDSRVPAEVSQEISRAYVQADDYIANYNIFMHNLLDATGNRLFPEGLKLITHWGLRDELKSQYAAADGLVKQKMIFAVMEHIIRQDIPQAVINSDQYDWEPIRNALFKDGVAQAVEPENDVRYQKLLQIFQAERRLDEYSPLLPTKMDRQFKKNREIPEEQFEALITAVLKAPVGKDVAKMISKRLNRPLQPFDIWYNGFKARSRLNEAELDQLVSAKYPTVAAFQQGIFPILTSLGFDEQTAKFLQNKITADPSRGAGHANGAMRREDNAHLRTRIPAGGMKYKGYNIAVHELGHNVEQVLSLNKIDHYMLNGVPNNAFTEAFAFVFQSRDLALLGKMQDNSADNPFEALDIYWSSCEIGAVGLVDMRLWRWMYAHPEATPAEVKQAAGTIATGVWNEFLYPMTGIRDCDILAIYSHIIAFGLYLPDYFLGQLIMFQIEDYLQDKNLGQEMERMCTLGRLTPDAWMRAAVGAPVSALPLIEAAQQAVAAMKK